MSILYLYFVRFSASWASSRMACGPWTPPSATTWWQWTSCCARPPSSTCAPSASTGQHQGNWQLVLKFNWTQANRRSKTGEKNSQNSGLILLTFRLFVGLLWEVHIWGKQTCFYTQLTWCTPTTTQYKRKNKPSRALLQIGNKCFWIKICSIAPFPLK